MRGHGIARQVQCARDGVALWTGWTCRVGEIIWDSPRKLPERAVPQQAPYTVLASSDWSGREFPVSSHLPMGWRTAGNGLHQSPPGEILLAPEHPVGASGWWTAQVFIPPLMVVAVAALVEVMLRRRRGYQKAR